MYLSWQAQCEKLANEYSKKEQPRRHSHHSPQHCRDAQTRAQLPSDPGRVHRRQAPPVPMIPVPGMCRKVWRGSRRHRQKDLELAASMAQRLWYPNFVASIGVVPGTDTATTVAGGNGPGDSLRCLNRPRGLFVTPDESVYVSDAGNHRIVKFCYYGKILFTDLPSVGWARPLTDVRGRQRVPQNAESS
jgi:hypothetical protein